MKRRKKKLTDRHKTREVDKKIDIGANFILYTGKALHKKKKKLMNLADPQYLDIMGKKLLGTLLGMSLTSVIRSNVININVS